MWKSLYDLVRTLFTLSDHVLQNREELKEIRKDLYDLTLAVERLSGQVAQVSDREERERAMLVLQLQNSLLRGGGQVLLAGEADGSG